jgi:hypothetical protein
MTIDKMTVDKMTVDKMTEDKMTLDKMPRRQLQTFSTRKPLQWDCLIFYQT